MKFLLRRIRYAFSGKIMRLFTAIGSLLVIVVLVFVFFSGMIDQRSVFEKFFHFTWNSSQKVADDIDNGDIPLEVNDRGVYFKGSKNNDKVEESSTEEVE